MTENERLKKARAAWNNMKRRCHYPLAKQYKHYGGRGIRVCSDWQHDFEAFLKHVGLPDDASLSLDRIDNDGDYEPGNVRWAPMDVQLLNREHGYGRPRVADYDEVRKLSAQGLTPTEISRILNVGRATVYRALQ